MAISVVPSVTIAMEPSAAGTCALADFLAGSITELAVVSVLSVLTVLLVEITVDSAAHLRSPFALQTISIAEFAPFYLSQKEALMLLPVLT